MSERYQRSPAEVHRKKLERKKRRTRRRILTILAILCAFLLGIAVGRSSKNANFIGQAWNGSEGETSVTHLSLRTRIYIQKNY